MVQPLLSFPSPDFSIIHHFGVIPEGRCLPVCGAKKPEKSKSWFTVREKIHINNQEKE